MPRKDYEKLKKLWSEYADTEKYSCVFSDQNLTDGNLFVTIRDNNTTAIKPYQTNMDISHGVALDVLPLDGWPNSRIKRKFQVFWARYIRCIARKRFRQIMVKLSHYVEKSLF